LKQSNNRNEKLVSVHRPLGVTTRLEIIPTFPGQRIRVAVKPSDEPLRMGEIRKFDASQLATCIGTSVKTPPSKLHIKFHALLTTTQFQIESPRLIRAAEATQVCHASGLRIIFVVAYGKPSFLPMGVL